MNDVPKPDAPLSADNVKAGKSTWTIVFLVLIIGSAGGWAYHRHHRYKHFVVHDPGKVYASAWLEPDVIPELIHKYQIRTVVNLCNPGEMGLERWIGERRAVTGAGARLLELPMPTTTDPFDSQVARHIQVLSDPESFPLLVHCQHGVTRTTKFLAIYDVLFRGMSADASLDARPLFGRAHHKNHVRAFAHQLERERDKLRTAAAIESSPLLR